MSKHDPLDVLKEEIVRLKSIQKAMADDEHDDRKDLGKTIGEVLGRMDPAVERLKQERKMRLCCWICNWWFNSSLTAEEQTPKQPIQILNAVQTETTYKFCSSLTTLDIVGVHLMIISKADTVDDHIPLVILCPNSSRLKPDVDLALEGFQRPFRSAMIIIHTVSERHLPSLTSAEILSSYSDYNNITFIDMGFEQDRGIYKCNQNRKAFQQLKAFVVDFYQQTK